MPIVDRKSEIQKIAEASVGISLPSGTMYYGEPLDNYQGITGTPYLDKEPQITYTQPNPNVIDDGLIERIWEKMYHKKVILTCKWCGAANAFDNPTCVQCGGPPG